jgi:hypothetical protein
VFLKPFLQQVPCSAVAVDPVQHRRVRVDTGDFAEQVNVDAEPAAAVDGPGQAGPGCAQPR